MLDIWFIIGLLAMVLPGAFLTRKLGVFSPAEWMGLSVLFSFIFWGNLAYFISWFTPFTSTLAHAGVILIALMGVYFRAEIAKGIRFQLERWTRVEWLLAVGIICIIGIVFLHAWNVSDTQYDTLSYHAPFIDDFVQQGHFSFYADPVNNYEIRSNLYPKFFEALGGFFTLLSSDLGKIISPITFLICILLGGVLSRRMGGNFFFGSALIASSTILIWQGISWYVDHMVTALVLLIVWSLIAEIDAKKKLLLIALACGTILATKATAVILIPLLLIGIWIVTRPKWKPTAIPPLLGTFLIGGGFVGMLQIWNYLQSPVSAFAFGGGNVGIIGLDKISFIISNLHTLIAIAFRGSVWGLIPITAIPFYVFSLFQRKNPEQQLVHTICKVGLIGMIAYALLTVANARMDTFPRFVLPFAVLALLLGAAAITRYLQSISQNPKPFYRWATAMLHVCFLVVVCFGVYSNIFLVQESMGTTPQELNYAYFIQKNIPNNSSTIVFFANTPNGIEKGIERAVVWDYSTFKDFPREQNACDFLWSKGVTHLAYSTVHRTPNELGALNEGIVRAVESKQCGRVVDRYGSLTQIIVPAYP